MFDRATAEEMLGSVFAPWVQDLGLSIESLDKEGAVLRMRFSERLCRDNGVVCGQALMSLADTAMVFAVSSAGSAYRPMTTVDQTMHFLRPAANADILAEAKVVRLGRTMAFGSVTLTTDGRYAAGGDGAARLRPAAREQIETHPKFSEAA